MEGADWLRTQLTSFGCAACGHPFEAARIRVLAERDGLFFVDLACERCGSQAVAIVTITLDEDAEPRAEAGEMARLDVAHAGAARPADAVSADDVLAVHDLLAGFHGGIDELLRHLDGSAAP